MKKRSYTAIAEKDGKSVTAACRETVQECASEARRNFSKGWTITITDDYSGVIVKKFLIKKDVL